MKKILKVFLIAIAIIVAMFLRKIWKIIFASAVFLGLIAVGSLDSQTYDSAKFKSETLLIENYEEFVSIAKDIYENKVTGFSEYRIDNVEINVHYDKTYEHNEKYVKFDIDAQGFLGGQYWGLYYVPEGTLEGENTKYVYDEFKERGKGNNVMIREKIMDNWFFYYDDYDGKVKET